MFFIEKYKSVKILNIFLIVIFLFSSNILEDSLLINLFSLIVLLSIYFIIKLSRALILRIIRKQIKLTYRIQKKFLKRCYFCFIRIIKFKAKYLKKLSKKYFFIKYKKLIIFAHLKYKFFFFKLIFFKLYFLNLANKLLFNISFDLIALF